MIVLMAVAAFLTSVAGHLGAVKLWPRQNRVFSFLSCGFFVGGIFLAILLKMRSSLEALEAAVIYAFACELYIFLFTFVIGSISVVILIQLKEDGCLPEFQAETADDNFIGGRIQRMLELGILGKEGEHLRLTVRGRILLRAYKVLRSFFRHQGAYKEMPDRQRGGQPDIAL
ncbi:MAG: hypothetical protein C5B47_03515 [Verrucomicrobia bacterium]|nr:MAG: hypothetical protein C5B47_03515 [Verrucomicrobiota bacterium]